MPKPRPDRVVGSGNDLSTETARVARPRRARPTSDFEWPMPADALELFEIVPLEDCPRSIDEFHAALLGNGSATEEPGLTFDPPLQSPAEPPLAGWTQPMPARPRLSERWRAGLAFAVGLGCAIAAYLAAPVMVPSPAARESAATVAAKGQLLTQRSVDSPPRRIVVASKPSKARPAGRAPTERPRPAVRVADTSRSSERRPPPLQAPARSVTKPVKPEAPVPSSAPVIAVAARSTPPPLTTTVAPGTAPAVDAALAATTSAPPARTPAEPVLLATPPAAPHERDRIESTLTRFRRAYSQLDVKAARAVWPGVDARALTRAFDGLKSQEIAFDHCDLVVRDGEASAACRGRSTYVPRVGSQVPRTDERQWTFELKMIDQQWTIQTAAFR